MLAFGILYLQNHLGLEPCPMCIVQRYAMTVIGLLAVVALMIRHARVQQLWVLLGFLTAGFGATGLGVVGLVMTFSNQQAKHRGGRRNRRALNPLGFWLCPISGPERCAKRR